ncbi:hypothetical protein D3C81_1352300 [compost metagenome]
MLATVGSTQHQTLLAHQHAPAIVASGHAVQVRAVDVQRLRCPGLPTIRRLIELAEAAERHDAVATARPDAQQRFTQIAVVANFLPAAARVHRTQDPAVMPDSKQAFVVQRHNGRQGGIALGGDIGWLPADALIITEQDAATLAHGDHPRAKIEQTIDLHSVRARGQQFGLRWGFGGKGVANGQGNHQANHVADHRAHEQRSCSGKIWIGQVIGPILLFLSRTRACEAIEMGVASEGIVGAREG